MDILLVSEKDRKKKNDFKLIINRSISFISIISNFNTIGENVNPEVGLGD